MDINNAPERELNPPDKIMPTFDDLNYKDQCELLDMLFAEDQSNSMVSMHDNETLHKVIEVVHSIWQQSHGMKREELHHANTKALMLAWDNALRTTLTSYAECELEDRHNAALEQFNEEE